VKNELLLRNNSQKKAGESRPPGFWHFEETVISLMAVFL